MAETVAKNDKGPHERPTVGMQLGGGDVHFGQEHALEGSERYPKSEPSKGGGVNEAEGALGV